MSSAVYYTTTFKDTYAVYFRQNSDNSVAWAKYASYESSTIYDKLLVQSEIYINNDETRLIILDLYGI